MGLRAIFRRSFREKLTSVFGFDEGRGCGYEREAAA